MRELFFMLTAAWCVLAVLAVWGAWCLWDKEE